MMPQNLNALFPMLSAQPGSGPLPAGRSDGLGSDKGAPGSWAEILASFENLAGSDAQAGLESLAESMTLDGPGERSAELQALLASLHELQALAVQTDSEEDAESLAENLVAQFNALFALLESPRPTQPDPGAVSGIITALEQDAWSTSYSKPPEEVLKSRPEIDRSLYSSAFWPDSGEMILLLQGINPWGEDLQPEQMQWLEQVGPYLGVPELIQSYSGPTELGRDFTVVNLAEAAGADPQRAFVDAWLGRHKPEIAQNLYQSRWDWNQSRGSAAVSPLPEPTLPGVRLSDMLEMARETDLGAKGSMPELNRSVLFSQMSAAQGAAALDFRDPSAQSSRADVSLTQINPSLVARDPALPPTTLLSGQPQSSAAELRAAAEQAMERVVWMAARKQGVSQARLQLHPAHLGKLDIRLEVQGREASLHMSVHNAPVREAVEAMLPRLREQLEQQGLNLGDAWVFDSGPEDAPERERAMLAEAGSIGAEDDLDQSGDSQDLPRRGVGLLDEFA